MEEFDIRLMTDDYPLSGREVMDIVGYPVRIVTFNLIDQLDLEDLFLNDLCLINYLHEERFGHWCCLCRDGDTITYFNPSGNFIDDAREGIPDDYIEISNQKQPHLLKLLYSHSKKNGGDYDIRYMDFPLQSYNTNTCGRWCGLFMRYYLMGEENFIKLFSDKSNLDKMIIDMTEPVLRGVRSKGY